MTCNTESTFIIRILLLFRLGSEPKLPTQGSNAKTALAAEVWHHCRFEEKLTMNSVNKL